MEVQTDGRRWWRRRDTERLGAGRDADGGWRWTRGDIIQKRGVDDDEINTRGEETAETERTEDILGGTRRDKQARIRKLGDKERWRQTDRRTDGQTDGGEQNWEMAEKNDDLQPDGVCTTPPPSILSPSVWCCSKTLGLQPLIRLQLQSNPPPRRKAEKRSTRNTEQQRAEVWVMRGATNHNVHLNTPGC